MNNTVSPVETIDSWTTVDLDLSYTLEGLEPTWVEALSFNLNITNLFDKDPPLASLAPSANQSGGFDVQQSNPLGRLITFGVTAKF